MLFRWPLPATSWVLRMGTNVWSGMPPTMTTTLLALVFYWCNKLLQTWQLNTSLLSPSFTAWLDRYSAQGLTGLKLRSWLGLQFSVVRGPSSKLTVCWQYLCPCSCGTEVLVSLLAVGCHSQQLQATCSSSSLWPCRPFTTWMFAFSWPAMDFSALNPPAANLWLLLSLTPRPRLNGLRELAHLDINYICKIASQQHLEWCLNNQEKVCVH